MKKPIPCIPEMGAAGTSNASAAAKQAPESPGPDSAVDRNCSQQCTDQNLDHQCTHLNLGQDRLQNKEQVIFRKWSWKNRVRTS